MLERGKITKLLTEATQQFVLSQKSENQSAVFTLLPASATKVCRVHNLV